MNIFYLHKDPIQNVKWHVDKHVVKMATEYAQLLSTAHRVIDGELYEGRTKIIIESKGGNYLMKGKVYCIKQVM